MSVEAFDEILSRPTEYEWWWEFDQGDAIELMWKFDEADWEQLKAVAHEKDRSWQGRCVESLSGATVKHGAPVLLSFIEEGDVSLAVGACDSLRCILEREHVKLPVSKTIHDKLLSLLHLTPHKNLVLELLKHVTAGELPAATPIR